MEKFRIKRIYQEVNGLDYMSKYVRLKSVGTAYKACCPFHNEKTASFTIYPKDHMNNGVPQDHTSFYCFGCGAGGDIIEFVKLKNGLKTRTEAVEFLEKEYNLKVDEEALNGYLQEELSALNISSNNLLPLYEANLSVSCNCRKYLDVIKKKFNFRYDKEVEFIDKVFYYLDETFPDCNDMETNILIKKVDSKLERRLDRLNKKYQKQVT